MPNVKGGGGQIDTGAAAHEQGSSRRGQEGGLVRGETEDKILHLPVPNY